MIDVVIVGAARTPIGAFGGGLSDLPAHRLGEVAIKAALARSKVPAADVTEVILGQVLVAGAGQNPARQAAVAAGIPYEATAYGINQICGSGLRAVALGYQAIRSGDANIVVAGGQESMSQSPHVATMRKGVRMGNVSFIDSMIKDGLTDAFYDYHMGVTAENIARQWKISREEQDAFAFESQQKAAKAVNGRRFREEIAPVTITTNKGEAVIDKDESPRGDSSLDRLSKLRPAFEKNGTVTSGNASSINDGAAAVILMTTAEANKRNLTPLARIVSWATSGIDPTVMGIGPVLATRKSLAYAGWKLDDIDLIEANEAFASQSIAVARELGFDSAKVNVNGGAISIGHPIGASGARVLVTLLYEMQKRDVKRGLVTLCIGGGMGIAMCLER